MRKRYRIVTDRFAGYEVQEWCWWWPFWRQSNFTNTHSSLEKAEEYAARSSGKVVKELGWLP